MLKRHPALPYVLPFAVYIVLLAAQSWFPGLPEIMQAARLLLTLLVTVPLLRRAVPLKLSSPGWSVVCGVAIFAIWVGPDLVWPHYREHWLFQNRLTGTAESSLPRALLADPVFIAIRLMTTVLLVPVIEELFWRGWLMRWMVRKDFQSVPLGAYTADSFWITAVLFASEHGPYWDVGLVAGVVFGAWLLRTRSLGDCVLAHAVANLCLALHVLVFARWQYWL